MNTLENNSASSSKFSLNTMEERLAFLKLTVLDNKFIPHKPTVKQAEFLVRVQRELFYGGAAGGGKSDALLMAALQFVDYKGYNALLLRRTFSSLVKPEALIHRSHEWLTGTAAKWDARNYIWTFPSGATISFGYLESDNDVYQYQSAAYQFIGWDELTQFTSFQYTFMFSRCRRLIGVELPLRIRAASNPGNEGHKWVKDRFIQRADKSKSYFISAKISDNPHLDKQEYQQNLSQLDNVTRLRLEDGDWDVDVQGNKFKPEWFNIIKRLPDPSQIKKAVSFWDFAGGKPKKKGDEPDWTVNVKMLLTRSNEIYIPRVVRIRESPLKVQQTVRKCAEEDGKRVTTYLEQEPGSAGEHLGDHYKRDVMLGYTFKMIKTTGDKEFRADPYASFAESGHLYLLQAPWNEEFIEEHCVFPNPNFKDDQVDSGSGAFEQLVGRKNTLSLILAAKQTIMESGSLKYGG